MNIGNFIVWFFQQFVNIGIFMVGKIDQIKIGNNISLLDFTITIAIIGALISILITAPMTGIAKGIVGREKRNDRKSK